MLTGVESTVFTEHDREFMFLSDGFAANPSPALLVVAEEAAAGQVALAVYNGSLTWHNRPARLGRLMRMELERIASSAATDYTPMLAEVADTDHWLYLPDVDSLLTSLSGRRFLDVLMTWVGDGNLAAVIASTTREQLPELHAKAPRLMGFADALHVPNDSGTGGLTSTRTLVVPTTDSDDVGWLVAVRLELTGPIQEVAEQPDVSTDDRLRLVDTVHMVVDDNAPPVGVLIGLTPDAFTVSQEDAAFTSAALTAERLVGRPLAPNEHITPARAIFFA
jgi:hypothetical protein